MRKKQQQEQATTMDYLADERNKAEFDVETMKIVWAGSREAFEVADRISKLVAEDPVLSLILTSSLCAIWFSICC